MISPADRLHHVKEYYFSKKLKEIDLLNRQGEKVINLGIGSPDLPPSRETIDRLMESAGEAGSHGYQGYLGIPALRQAFAGWYKTYYNVQLNPDHEILPLIGSKEGILYVSMAFLNPGDRVLIPNPGYPTYRSVSNLLGAKIVEYNLLEKQDWVPDFESLQAMDLSGVKLMWVNYPNMPTGADADMRLFEQLIAFGKEYNILICNDNPYSFILNDHPKSIFNHSAAKEHCLELNSLSKSHNMAGWRMGMLAGNEYYIQQVIKVNSNVHSGMFLPVQKAAVQALQNPPGWYASLNKEYKERRKIVWQIMDYLQVQYDTSQKGMFVWGKIPDAFGSSEELTDFLLEKSRVFVTPGSIFGSNGKHFTRISLCTNQTILNEAYNRIKKTYHHGN